MSVITYGGCQEITPWLTSTWRSYLTIVIMDCSRSYSQSLQNPASFRMFRTMAFCDERSLCLFSSGRSQKRDTVDDRDPV